MRVRLSLVLWKDFGKGGKSGAPERVREYAPRNVLLSFIAYVFVFLANLLHAVACIVNLSLGIGIMCCILNMHICFWGGGSGFVGMDMFCVHRFLMGCCCVG